MTAVPDSLPHVASYAFLGAFVRVESDDAETMSVFDGMYRRFRVENAPPEVKALARPSVDLKSLPFNPLEYIDNLDELPFDPALDPGLGE